MPTPKFDKLCIELVKRIPDQLQDDTFVPGSGELPDAFLLKAEIIIDFINRALQTFFNLSWQKLEEKVQAFINTFPEMQKVSDEEALTAGIFEIEDPYLDFYKIIGAFITGDTIEGRIYAKPKAENLYTHFLAGKYKSYQATVSDPAIIQVEKKLEVFPKDTSFANINFHYIKLPLDPETGNPFIQDGDYDSPFAEQWHKEIVNIAYGLWLEEAAQTQ